MCLFGNNVNSAIPKGLAVDAAADLRRELDKEGRSILDAVLAESGNFGHFRYGKRDIGMSDVEVCCEEECRVEDVEKKKGARERVMRHLF